MNTLNTGIRFLLASLLVGTAGSTALAQPDIDGLLTEWSNPAATAADPAGDATSVLDLTEVRAISNGTVLYVYLDFANSFNLASGPSGIATLRMTVTALAPTTRSITIDFRNRRAWLDGNSGVTVSWPSIGFAALPTTATDRFEMRIDLAAIGIGVGQTMQIQFDTADALAAPLAVQLTTPTTDPTRRSAARPTCPTLRVATLNTEQTGLTNATRRPALLRLIDAVNADVYCFSEEYNSSQAQVLQALTDADPLENALPWNVQKVGELVIASQKQLVQIPFGSAYSGAVVRLGLRPDGGPDFAVINNHMKCCGYTGNSDDSQRITQATAATQVFTSFRAGTLSPALAPYNYAPALVVGDWNLVGSTTPLDLWTNPAGPALTRDITRNLIGNDAWTWRSGNGLGFWPGTLDLIAYDAARMRPRRSFVFDTSVLNASELAALGVQAGDSAVTDHLMLVMDIALGANSDFNAMGGTTVQDVFDFLAAWFAESPTADANADAAVTIQDVFDFLGAWFGGC